MIYKRIEPDPELSAIIECYWMVSGDESSPEEHKVIPDGFPEIIFHFGDLYRILLEPEWRLQSRSLVAGQITKYFFLENTGVSDILAVKLKPAAFYQLFRFPMDQLTDKVVPIASLPATGLEGLEKLLHAVSNNVERIVMLNMWFKRLMDQREPIADAVQSALDNVDSSHGMLQVAELSKAAGVGERQLENFFRTQVGVPPKLFARIRRFNYIFELLKDNGQNWSALANEAAYYDQSHFIRNFKDFTGESPAAYAFDEKNLANFFLNKTLQD